ncbi:MAG: type I-E CRISPR-associated protein Cse2/CasB [Nitrospinae bacterium]|nr:type I-E CRISPR-associated protein Cse2/CasB [Nitrospinota bacterium]
MSVGRIVIEWWRSSLGRDDGQARAARARLRRCESPAEALAVAETHDLNASLKRREQNPTSDQLALLVTVFARLAGVDGEKLAVLLGRQTMKQGPRTLSELRFQSLIRFRSRRDLMTPLRRSLSVLGANPACNGHALAEDLYFWNDGIRNRWCFQYFGAEYVEINQEETVT